VTEVGGVQVSLFAWDELARDLVRTKAPRTQCEDQGALAKVIRCLVEYTDVLDSEICSTGFVINQHYVGLNEFVG
jgi:hypothetical protein